MAVWIEWVLLLGSLPFFIFIKPEQAWLLALLPLIWLWHKWRDGYFFMPTPLNGAMLLLAIMTLVGTLVTFDIAFSLPKIAGILYGITLFYAIVATVSQSPKYYIWLLALYIGLGVGIAGITVISTAWRTRIPFIDPFINRLPAQLLNLPGVNAGINPNEVAGVLLWLTPLLLVLAIATFPLIMPRLTKTRLSFLWLPLPIIALGLTMLLIITQSRGGILGLAGSMLFAGIVAILHQVRGRSMRIIVGVLLLLVLAAGIWGGGKYLTAQETLGTDFTSEGAVLSLDGRLEIWSRALYGIQDFPFTGMGIGTFRRVVHILYPLFLISPDSDIAHAHNHLLQVALDLGLPGLIAYLAIWLGSGQMLWQVWRQGDYWQRSIALGLAASLLGYAIFGFFDTVALGAKPGFLFWMLLGLSTGLHQLSGNR